MVWSHSYFAFHVLVVLLLNMEGAMKLKFCQTARLEVCYGMVDIIFCQSQNFQILANFKNHGL